MSATTCAAFLQMSSDRLDVVCEVRIRAVVCIEPKHLFVRIQYALHAEAGWFYAVMDNAVL